MQALLAGCAAGAVLAWGLGHAGWHDASAAAGPLGLLLITSWLGLRRPPAELDLHWDGGRWSVQGNVGSLAVMLDLGAWLLLRLQPEARAARAVWVAVARHEAGPAWHGLRAAAYSRVPAVVRSASQPARAE